MKVTKVLMFSVTMLLGATAFSCKAKSIAATTVAESSPVKETEIVYQNTGNGNEPECDNLYGADSLETRKQVSLYRDEFNRGNYMAAVPGWRYVYKNAPCFKEYITADGAYLMKVLIGNTKDTALIRAYADTMMQIYDTRIRLFGRKADVVGRKGRDMFTYQPQNTPQAIALMTEAMDAMGKETDEYLLSDLMRASVTLNRNTKSISDDEIINLFDKEMGVLDYNIKSLTAKFNDANAAGQVADTAKYGKSLRVWQSIEAYVTDMVSPYLTCEKLTQIYQPKFKATPDDSTLVFKIITLLKRSPDCGKTDFYLEVAEKNFKLKPDAEGAAALAKAFQDKNEDTKAKQYYLKAAELEPDNGRKATYYLVLASIELSAKNCQQARTYARRALDFNPKSGDAYMVIGNAYMTCGSGCGGSNKVDAYYPYLAAYDKFLQAKNVDPSVAADANARMALAQKYFPLKEDAFFAGIPEGQSVETGCWIGETTTLRTRKE